MGALQTSPLTRGIAPAAPPARVATEEEIAAFTVGGEVFLVDLGDYHLDGTALGAVIRWDGSIGIEYVRWHDAIGFKTSERAGLYDVDPDKKAYRRIRESHGCVILGRVIERS